MDEKDFEGTLVLEQIAEIGLIDKFYEAIDSDDIDKMKLIMKKAKIDIETRTMVLKKMNEEAS